ncbi:hypothetical protein ACJX0J_011428, partial [Zea mays]
MKKPCAFLMQPFHRFQILAFISLYMLDERYDITHFQIWLISTISFDKFVYIFVWTKMELLKAHVLYSARMRLASWMEGRCIESTLTIISFFENQEKSIGFRFVDCNCHILAVADRVCDYSNISVGLPHVDVDWSLFVIVEVIILLTSIFFLPL